VARRPSARLPQFVPKLHSPVAIRRG
jgi:hypothetical protein